MLRGRVQDRAGEMSKVENIFARHVMKSRFKLLFS